MNVPLINGPHDPAPPPPPQVLMYCTAGVRCERASAFMRKRGIQNVFQLEGGIHRYLDAYPEDGGFWVRHGTNTKGMRTERQ